MSKEQLTLSIMADDSSEGWDFRPVIKILSNEEIQEIIYLWTVLNIGCS
jgi:hypothetical protein